MDPLLEIRDIANDLTLTAPDRIAQIRAVLNKTIPVEEPKAPGALVQMTREILRGDNQTLTLMYTLHQWVVVVNGAAPTDGNGAVWTWRDITSQAMPGTLKIVNPGYTNITQEV